MSDISSDSDSEQEEVTRGENASTCSNFSSNILSQDHPYAGQFGEKDGRRKIKDYHGQGCYRLVGHDAQTHSHQTSTRLSHPSSINQDVNHRQAGYMGRDIGNTKTFPSGSSINANSFYTSSGARPKTGWDKVTRCEGGGRADKTRNIQYPSPGQFYNGRGENDNSSSPYSRHATHGSPSSEGQIRPDRGRQLQPDRAMRSDSRTQTSDSQSEHFAHQKIQEWSRAPNNVILVFEMSTHVKSLSKLLSQGLRFDDVRHLVLVLKKIISVQSQRATLCYVLKSVCQSRFLTTHLPMFFDQLKEKGNCPDVYGYFHKIIDILEFIMRNLGDFLPMCYQPLQQLLETGKRLNVVKDHDAISNRVEKLLQHSATVPRPERQGQERQGHSQTQERSESSQGRKKKFTPALDEATPPDDYKQMAIFPDTAELDVAIEPFLRKNKTKGAYRNLDHYLDIQARLMREDYLAPIRTGLRDFKLALEDNQRKVREDELRFYYKVQLVKMEESDQGISHKLTFDTSCLEHDIDWEHSRRLMFGSLLVLSRDNFETTAFATVANRDVQKLQRGVLEVIFHSNLEEVFTSSDYDNFTMAETTAYFESYRHVLEGLQEMQEIPLERYIVYCKREIQAPSYLQPNTSYNIASIMNKAYDDYHVPVLNENEWPEADETSLNNSQLQAFKLALSNEMAVIQGPPGTGKTYVGLKIMQVLIENKVSTQYGKRGPILVVCFTNHALDQFLEGVLEFCPEGIVRVGGRSSSTRLEKFNLKELRQNPSLSRKIRENIRKNLRNCSRELKKIMKYIDRFWQESLRLETTIMTCDDLREEIDDVHLDSLTDPMRISSPHMATHVISTWLKALNANMDNHLNKAAKRHLAKLIASGTGILPDSVLTNEMSARKADFRTRVRIYHLWVEKYKAEFETEVDLLLLNGDKNSSSQNQRLQKLIEAGDEATQRILEDEKLKPFMSEKIYHYIAECVKRERKVVEENTYIEHWLLDPFTTTHQLLDAVEQLTEDRPDKQQTKNVQGDTTAESKLPPGDKKWVIDDSDESDETSDDSYETDDSDEETKEIDDVDDGGIVKLEEVRDLEETFKQLSNKEILMLQRARLLGIDLEETSESAGQEWQSTDKMSYSKVFRLYKNTVPFTEEEVANITDVWSLQLRDRYRLYKYWVQVRKHKLSNRLIDLTKEYKWTLQKKKEALSQKDIAILKRARVIGMTTTGAAKKRAVLQEVGSRIIVVEEAAEVLEAHIVTTLNKNCQHLILIGDHQQLRPSPTVHRLAVDYDLEMSLFERLVKNHVPHVTLNEQHRMRPEISTFLQHIYPRLRDHSSVLRHEHVEGVQSDVFFLHHTFEESAVEDSMTKANLHEAKFLTGLCKYFLQHGYQGTQITVLAAYGGQVQAIRNEMAEDSVFESVKVTSIDNYQGEENEIVLLSLVRSNVMNDVGFLKTDNRVCVALSRAKKGMFVIGNLHQLAAKSDLWRNILFTAQAFHVTGVHMRLTCVNHAQHVTYVSNPEDFVREVPEGGCHRPCNFRLPCGHNCTRMCHASDRFHENTKCEQPCLKMCPYGHLCQRDCYQECGQCELLVTKYIPVCGHEAQVPCYQDVEDAVCTQMCGELLPCGHQCRGQCGTCRENERHQPCLEKIDRVWPCGHSCNVECRTDTSEDPCPTKCKDRLECGHRCKGTCGSCLSGRVHRACGEPCKKPLPCGHPCQGPCGGQCVPCETRCPTCCRHTSCSQKTCGEVCDLCTENCPFVCKHKTCNSRCMDMCQAPACSRPCNELVSSCKHKCRSLCGEPCVCYMCNKEKFSLIDSSNKKKPQYLVKHEQRERAKKFDLENDTILMKIPQCDHVFTLKQLDRYVESFEPSNTSFIRCPVCPTPIQRISRYEAVNKRRAEKRENRKQELWDSNRVSEEKLEILRQSKDILADFCRVDDGEFLIRKPEQIDTNHAMAITMQIRFAHALSKISTLHKEFNGENEFKVKHLKRVITSIQRHVTDQFRKEMTSELYRLFHLEEIFILGKLAKEINMTLAEETKGQCRVLTKELSKQKMSHEVLQRVKSTVVILYRLFDGPEIDGDLSRRVNDLKEQAKAIDLVLDLSHNKDLYTILLQS